MFMQSVCKEHHTGRMILQFHVQGRECGMTGRRSIHEERVATYIPAPSSGFTFI
jgi:hypothetical protein